MTSENIGQCEECGHLHYDRDTWTFEECPLRAEGCACPYAAGTPEIEDETRQLADDSPCLCGAGRNPATGECSDAECVTR